MRQDTLCEKSLCSQYLKTLSLMGRSDNLRSSQLSNSFDYVPGRVLKSWPNGLKCSHLYKKHFNYTKSMLFS